MSRPPFHQKISFEENQQAQVQSSRGGPAVPSKASISKGPGGYDGNVPTLGYEEAGYAAGGSNYPGFSGADVRRKKSMVRPERERIEPGHRHYHYREHAADDNVRVHPSGEYSKNPQ